MSARPPVLLAWALLGSMAVGCSRQEIRHLTASQVLEGSDFEWVTDSTRHVYVYFPQNTPAADSIERLKRQIEDSWTNVARFLGTPQYPHRIHAFLLPDSPALARAARLSRGGADGLNYWETRVTFNVVRAQGWPGGHEFVHVIAHDAWGDAKEWWLGEGLAVAADSVRAGYPIHAVARSIQQRGMLYPMDKLAPQLGRRMNARVLYVQAGSFVKFVIDTYGVEKMRQIYPVGAAAVPRTYGKTLAELEAEWLRFLSAVDAAHVLFPLESR